MQKRSSLALLWALITVLVVGISHPSFAQEPAQELDSTQELDQELASTNEQETIFPFFQESSEDGTVVGLRQKGDIFEWIVASKGEIYVRRSFAKDQLNFELNRMNRLFKNDKTLQQESSVRTLKYTYYSAIMLGACVLPTSPTALRLFSCLSIPVLLSIDVLRSPITIPMSIATAVHKEIGEQFKLERIIKRVTKNKISKPVKIKAKRMTRLLSVINVENF